MSATSCLQHKALGQFFGLYPQNVQLNYDLSNFKQGEPSPVAAPMSDEEIVENFDIDGWYVTAFPKSGNPSRKDYEFPLKKWDEQTQTYTEFKENLTGAFLPIFSEGDYEHFRGVYDFIVCSEPLCDIPLSQLRKIASGESLAELETREPNIIQNYSYVLYDQAIDLKLAEDVPVKNGCPFIIDGEWLRLYYGTLGNELVPGSDQENTTHNADVLIKFCESRSTDVELPNINLVSRESRLAAPNSVCIVTGLAETWKLGQDKAGAAYNLIQTVSPGLNYRESIYFSHLGKSPAADKVELYVLTALEKTLLTPGTAGTAGEEFLFYRKYDITDAIVNGTEVNLGEDFEWTPDFTDKLPSKEGDCHWYEIIK